MTDDLKVSKGEHGVYRIFAIDLPEREIAAFVEETYPEDDDAEVVWPLRDALGVTYLDHDFIEVIDVDDLGEMGLAGYLIEGMDLEPAQVEPHRRQFEDTAGKVLIAFSTAFGGFEAVLQPKSPLRLLAVLREKPVVPDMDPITAESAKGILDGTPGPAPRRKPGSGLVALLILGVIVALFILLRGGG